MKNGESNIWFGLFVPAKTPRDVVEKMHAAGSRVLATPQMQDSLTKLGVSPDPMTPTQMDALVVRDVAANKAVIQAAGIKMN